MCVCVCKEKDIKDIRTKALTLEKGIVEMFLFAYLYFSEGYGEGGEEWIM